MLSSSWSEFQPGDVILPSGKQYAFHYDVNGNVHTIEMPSLSTHRFGALASLSLLRLTYKPPGSHGTHLRDFDSDGRLTRVIFPSGHRRVTYDYSSSGHVASVFHDWTDVTVTYHGEGDRVRRIASSDRLGSRFESTLEYEMTDVLVSAQRVTSSMQGSQLLDATFSYAHDAFLLVGYVDAVIGRTRLPPLNITRDAQGRTTRINDFLFARPNFLRDVIRDANVEIVSERDAGGRLSKQSFQFNGVVRFSLEATYTSQRRLRSWRRRSGSSDVKSYDFSYDSDGNLVSFDENGQTRYRFEYDVNNNVQRMTHYRSVTQLQLNSFNQLLSDGQSSHIYDADGFLIQRGSDVFEFNSRAQLTHAFRAGAFDIFYYYDALGRLVARRDALSSNDVTQYFYSDLHFPNRVTHTHRHHQQETTTYFYDDHQSLFALQRGRDMFYVAQDPLGSPIFVMNYHNSVVKRILFDPLGRATDSDPGFFLPFGFRGGIYDPVVGFVFFSRGHLSEGSRGGVYDTRTGRWTHPDLDTFLSNVGRTLTVPDHCNHYKFEQLVNPRAVQETDLMTGNTSQLHSSFFL